MNGKSKSPETIANFLADHFGPDGEYGAGCYKCGQMVSLALSMLVAAGFDPSQMSVHVATIDDVSHTWVVADSWWIDPTIGQFDKVLPVCGQGRYPLTYTKHRVRKVTW
jgi:hypothetical protein